MPGTLTKMDRSNTVRGQLLARLQGQKVEIPNLLPMYHHWPAKVNPARSSIEETVYEILENHSVTPAVELKLKQANLPLLIASWYPTASYVDLESITYFVCWMYVVDDAIIDKVSWPGQVNEALFDEAKDELLSYVETSLNLDDKPDPEPASQPASFHAPAIRSFRRISQVLCQRYTTTQRRRFLTACHLTMDGYQSEQRLRVADKIPTWSEYAYYRRGSCCMWMCIAMIEFATELQLPTEIIGCQEMRTLWYLTAQVSWLMNDIVSAKKELREGFVENAVAILALDSGNCQTGLDKTIEHEKQAISNFDATVQHLRQKVMTTTTDSKLLEDLDKFIDGCKHICTGALHWSLTTPRYGLTDLPRSKDGNKLFFVGD